MLGRSLGHYRLVEQIGAGGMGEVFRAHDEHLDRHVAIKLLPLETTADEQTRKRFRQEAIALSRLAHANVAVVHDFATEDGIDYLVTELIPGEDMGGRLHGRPLPEKEVLRLGLQLAEGLSAAHEQGVVHRDLKPTNLRITPEGQLKILDFGLAKLIGSLSLAIESETIARTQQIVGTLPYMSPEQLRGIPVDARSDLWSAGCVLYELATGRRPFEGATAPALTDAILRQPPPPPRAVHGAINPELERIIIKCLEKDREDRYQSARELAVDLGRLASNATPAAPVRIIPRRAARIAIGATAVILLTIVAAIVLRRPPAPAARPSITSIAVLPLENFSSLPDQDYFADAMTEELTQELASLRSLRVISRTSAGRYRGTKKPLRDIARELNVDALVEGSLLHTGDQVRITVQLIHAATDQHLWAQSYQRRADDVIGLQREVASIIAREIQLVLTPAEKEHFETPITKNPQAYEAYLRAKYRLDSARRSLEDTDSAIALAQEAIDSDPGFAEAYVVLAEACIAKVFGGYGGREYDERAFLAISKALSLNPGLSEAYAVRGTLYYTRLHGFDIVRAVNDYRRAISLNPNLARAYHSLASELLHAGLTDAAIAEFRTALRLDPLDSGAKYRIGRALWQSQRFEEALRHFQQHNINSADKALALAYLGRVDQAWESLEELRQQSSSVHRDRGPALEDELAMRALLLALAGKAAEARIAIEGAVEAGGHKDHFHHAAFVIASAYGVMGEASDAVLWLRRVAENGMPSYPLFRDHASMRGLQGTPEYEQFMAELRPRWEQMSASLAGGTL
jgi:serine/threonine protein kinase/tetratricopeptide (TPR) repeat protein